MPELLGHWLIASPIHLLLGMILRVSAWLQFEVEEKGAEIRQTAVIDPAIIGGLLSWNALYPVHKIIFSGMWGEIKKRAVGV